MKGIVHCIDSSVIVDDPTQSDRLEDRTESSCTLRRTLEVSKLFTDEARMRHEGQQESGPLYNYRFRLRQKREYYESKVILFTYSWFKIADHYL